MIRVWGLETTGPGMGPEGAFSEYSEAPTVLDLLGLPDAVATVDVGVLTGDSEEPTGPMVAVYSLSVVGLETIEVAAGTIADALHLQLGLGGEFFGGGADEITEISDIWIQPGQLIVKWGQPAPGFGSLELVIPWS